MQELYHFSVLKEALLRKFCEANPQWQRPLSAFGVREIAKFQESLQAETGGRISEKWFYTHLKPAENEKLPRVDVLDLLSRYVGYEDWVAFQLATGIPVLPKKKAKTPGRLNFRSIVWIAAGISLVFLIVAAVNGRLSADEKKMLEACFADALTRQPIINTGIEVQVLRINESPGTAYLDSSACKVFEAEGSRITLVVKALYYLPDTLVRNLNGGLQRETFYLRRDDYAQMIHLFSTGQVEDWKLRRQQLGRMIADSAVMMQLDEKTGTGTELYNKEEFITKMTLPVAGLKNLRILETEYDQEGRINKLIFTQ